MGSLMESIRDDERAAEYHAAQERKRKREEAEKQARKEQLDAIRAEQNEAESRHKMSIEHLKGGN